MRANKLGMFELKLLLAVMQLKSPAFVLNIRKKIATATKSKAPTDGATHTTLDRLRKQRCLSFSYAPARKRKGGRKRKLVSITARGKKETLKALRSIRRLSKGIT